MPQVPRSLFCAVLIVGLLSPVAARAAERANLPPAVARAVDFENDVRPIFAASCIECHGPKKQRSDFRVDVKAIVLAGGAGGQPSVVPGKSADSPLIHYVAGLDEEMQLPPAGKGDPLTAAQIAQRQFLRRNSEFLRLGQRCHHDLADAASIEAHALFADGIEFIRFPRPISAVEKIWPVNAGSRAGCKRG